MEIRAGSIIRWYGDEVMIGVASLVNSDFVSGLFWESGDKGVFAAGLSGKKFQKFKRVPQLER